MDGSKGITAPTHWQSWHWQAQWPGYEMLQVTLERRLVPCASADGADAPATGDEDAERLLPAMGAGVGELGT